MDEEYFRIDRTPNGWQYVFQKLHQIAKANAGSQLMAKKPANVMRNRYRDVLPIDDTRVKLEDPENDYINANHVEVEEVNRKYILTQGPLQQTCAHYWEMIWEQKTAGIVMLNKCVERGMNKCYPYWPLIDDPPLEAGAFTVENLGCDEETSYRLSHLKLTNTETEESRVVLHFHYTQWPDFGVPQAADIFLEFLYAVRSSGVLGSDVGPSVVHCSAGIGRSGTFCLADVCLAKLEQTKDLSLLDLQQILLGMRRQRLGLIQTPDQLRFSYIAILQGALNDLGLENTTFDLEDSEEDSVEESESEEDEVEEEEEEEDETEDLESRLARKYPGLTRGSAERAPPYDYDGTPPPLPPRPPDIMTQSPDLDSGEESGEYDELPPAPSSAPPGPPLISNIAYSSGEEEGEEEEMTALAKKRKLDEAFDDVQEYGFKVSQYSSDDDSVAEDDGIVVEKGKERVRENGEIEGLLDQLPPPVPARSHSLSPESSVGSSYDREILVGSRHKRDIYEQANFEDEPSHFLGEKGGEKPSPPLVVIGNHTGALPDEVPPPLPSKVRRRLPSPAPVAPPPAREIEEEERALISELNELEKLVSRSDKLKPTPPPDETPSTASVTAKSENIVKDQSTQTYATAEENTFGVNARHQQRAEKQERIANHVRRIKAHLKDQRGEGEEEEEEAFESEWSIPWLLVGFIAVLGYCAYYFYS